MEKVSTNDVAKIICSILRKEQNIQELSAYELSSLIKLLYCLPEFSSFNDKVLMDFLDISNLVDNDIVEKIVGDDEKIVMGQNILKIEEYLSKFEPDFIRLCRTAINAKRRKEEIICKTMKKGELELVSPNDTYALSKVYGQGADEENVIFTDGDIEVLETHPNNMLGFSIGNIKVTNSTYNIFASLNKGEVLCLRVRCNDYASYYPLQEAENVFQGRVEHYEPIECEGVKVYKLRVH